MIPYCALNAHKLLYFSSYNVQHTEAPAVVVLFPKCPKNIHFSIAVGFDAPRPPSKNDLTLYTLVYAENDGSYEIFISNINSNISNKVQY